MCALGALFALALFWLAWTSIGHAAGTAATPSPASSPASLGAEGVLTTQLGPLLRDLIVAFSMDGPENGSAVFSRYAIDAKFSEQVSFGVVAGRQCANFAVDHAVLKLGTPLRLGPTYTYAAWLLLPAPRAEGSDIWQAEACNPLAIKNGAFISARDPENAEYCRIDPSLSRWHHVAVACDGRRLLFYLDGQRKGTIAWAINADLLSIGNKSTFSNQVLPAGCLDDTFIFGRDLTKEEIARVMQARLPAGLTPAGPSAAPAIASKSPVSRPDNTSDFPFGRPAPSSSEPASPAAAPTAVVKVAPLTTPATPADAARVYGGSLVQISGSKGSGAGFVANFEGKPYLVTSARVAAGVHGVNAQTIDGHALKADEASASAGHDIVRMEVTGSARAVEIMPSVETNVAVGDAITVLSNSPAGAVSGKVVALAPNEVEVDAPFTPANEGCPIVHLKTGRVLGVAACLASRVYDAASKGSPVMPALRRVAYRFDTVQDWHEVNWIFFYAQAAELHNIAALTDALGALLADLVKTHGVTPGLHTDPVLKSQVESWAGTSGGRASAANDQSFISFLQTTCQTDVTAERRRATFDCFKSELAEQQKARDELGAALKKAIEDLRKASK
jgi:hypothetical protein